MLSDPTTIWIIVGIFLLVSIVSAMVWWSLADRMFPGADKATGQRVDVFETGKVDRSRATVIRSTPPTRPDAKHADHAGPVLMTGPHLGPHLGPQLGPHLGTHHDKPAHSSPSHDSPGGEGGDGGGGGGD